ncbi:HAMP domain-containing sensor histidine kinase [Micrococcus sp.]|uniref:HAMP domain-containing sensor histidine kinase n=1 Tax=Micrococcus sp. TaxID=1271 RepID=UPI002A91398D|nr:HAMP domain-containing sensor histidine kinase [Micrococcus sp.]MDY6055094.1 HAMP domain-containing sensor histidine kinase [Micrococcus sp.]
MTTDTTKAPHRTGAPTRWRIVGWIVLTTAIALLAVTVTTRSVLLGQVADRANASVVQELDEFRTFAAEGVDPTTAQPFESTQAMLDRYLSRQTPATGEVLIGVAGQDAAGAPVLYLDNVGGGAGGRLATDTARLQSMLDAPQDGGIWDSPDGEVRWGVTRVDARGSAADGAALVVAHFTGREEDGVEREALVLFAVAAGGLLLTAGIAWLVAGRILRPLHQMRRAASRISATDLSARVPVEGDDDVARLALAINGMLDRVEQAQHDQQTFATQAQRHLDGPCERVRGAVAVLADPQADPQARERAVRDAEDGLAEMRRTMDSLGTLARQHTPDFVRPVEVMVDDILTRAYAEATRARPDRRWDLVEAGAVRAWIDPARVGEALRRLWENAAEHAQGRRAIEIGAAVLTGTPGQAQADVDAPARGRFVRLWVANDGAPLTQEEAERLYGDTRSSEGPGAGPGAIPSAAPGFGLALVRAVADAHHGSAWVESDAEGLTRFGLDLPADPPVGAAGTDRLAEEITESMRAES